MPPDSNFKPNILCFSGWAQNASALEPLLTPVTHNFQISSFDYLKFSDIDDLFAGLKDSVGNPDIIIGWSLGGQIALRLISQKIFKPQRLILISTPILPAKSALFEHLKDNLNNNSQKVAGKLLALMVKDDGSARNNIRNNLYLKLSSNNQQFLSFWLEELESFNSNNLDFTGLPETLIIHGDNDLVIDVNNSKLLAEKIANCKLELFNSCGHLPFIHDFQRTQKLIIQYINELYI